LTVECRDRDMQEQCPAGTGRRWVINPLRERATPATSGDVNDCRVAPYSTSLTPVKTGSSACVRTRDYYLLIKIKSLPPADQVPPHAIEVELHRMSR